jgi:hypothetical protein
MNNHAHKFNNSQLLLLFSTILFSFFAAGSVSAINRNPVADFDGDGKSDISVFRASSNYWYTSKESSEFSFLQSRMTIDMLMPEAGDNDEKAKTGQTFTANQPVDCTYSLSSTSISLGSGGYGVVDVHSNVGCAWTAVSNDSWIKVDYGASATGNARVSFSTAPNNTGLARSGTITIAGQTVTVNQLDVCTYSLSTTEGNYGANSGTGAAVVYTGAGCASTAISNVSWITVTSNASGTGNNLLVLFSIAANTGTTTRTGTLTIAGQIYTVVQPAPCRYSISPSNINIGENGGSGSFTVSSDTGCLWRASANWSWVRITSGQTGSGNGTVDFSVEANIGTTRTATISVGGQTFYITQDAITIPTLRINSLLRSEGNSGVLPLPFEVTLYVGNPTIPRTQNVTVDFATTDGTAIAGEDYIATSGTLTFAPGETTKIIPVPIIGDYTIEPDETFTVNLSNPVNATINRGLGEGTIWNDDTGGSFYISSANTVSESAGNTVVTIARFNGTASGVSVNYSTLNGTATAGQDYTAVSGTLNFGAGETSKTFTIPIINDAIVEPNETINLKLSNPGGGATLGTPGPSQMSVLTIVDDDGTPSLSINNIRNYEDTGAFNFRVILSGTISQTVTVDYSTADGTAVAEQDYVAASGTLSFAPGETVKFIPIVVRSGFNFYEGNETFTVNLSNPVNAAIANAQGTALIIHDDFFEASGSCTHYAFPTSMDLGAEASSGNTFAVVVQGNPSQNCGTFNATTSSSFITVDSRYSPASTNGIGTGSVAFSIAANTGAARSGTISVAGQTFTINQVSGTTTAPRKVLFDFDGDGKSDVSVFRPDNGVWYQLNSTSGFSARQFGMSTDKIAPADYDGDGKTDFAVFRDGNWYLQMSRDGFASIPFGSPGDIPAPADFDGDGKAELAVFRPSNGYWYVLNLVNNRFSSVQFGISEDKPVVADYDGDGKSDYAVYRPSNGVWYMLGSTKGFAAIQFGISSDNPVVGDYDGDGKADQAVYRKETGTWYIFGSTKGFSSTQFGNSTDIPAAADFDGDGITDIAVFRPNTGTWYEMKSKEGFGAVQFGSNGDEPTLNAFVP